ncbi:MAG: hypothetical protein AAFQ94_12930 [Bacteroidota bacterium]
MDIYNNIEFNKIYKADTDVLVAAQLVTASNGARGIVTIIRIDSDDNEYQVASASVHYYEDSNTFVPNNTATTIIKKGNRYKVVFNETWAKVDAYAYHERI